LYKKHKIKLRVLQNEVFTPAHLLERRIREKIERLPKIIDVLDAGETVFFIDETVVTGNQTKRLVWAPSGPSGPSVVRDNRSFKSIAVVGACTFQGKVVGVEISPKSIGQDEFIDLMLKLN